jgi:hypothetical protein
MRSGGMIAPRLRRDARNNRLEAGSTPKVQVENAPWILHD